jgi:nitroreductase
VPLILIEQSISAAQLSPSACNRQPWVVHIYRDPAMIKQLLALQNGNAGFGHRLSTLLVVTADSTSFFDASERNQAFVDAGLFTMSLILALQSRGLGSCCLNWCVTPDTDEEAHELGGIPRSHRIIMYLAVGYPEPQGLVPRSPRRALDSVICVH